MKFIAVGLAVADAIAVGPEVGVVVEVEAEAGVEVCRKLKLESFYWSCQSRQ